MNPEKINNKPVNKRANPGVLLLKSGTVINKWHYNAIPEAKEIEDQYLSLDK